MIMDKNTSIRAHPYIGFYVTMKKLKEDIYVTMWKDVYSIFMVTKQIKLQNGMYVGKGTRKVHSKLLSKVPSGNVPLYQWQCFLLQVKRTPAQ